MSSRRRFLALGLASLPWTHPALSPFFHDRRLSAGGLQASGNLPKQLIIDTHQHLWDYDRIKPYWLAGAPQVLNRPSHLREYREATEGLDIRAVYMEVDVGDDQLDIEAEHVIGLCQRAQTTIAAVLGGNPGSERFKNYLDRWTGNAAVKGIRRVLHGIDQAPSRFLSDPFVAGIRELGVRRLMFDLCMKPGDLPETTQLVRRCPGTHFILDHCGNPKLDWFRPRASEEAAKSADQWKRSIEQLAACPNLHCKISGIISQMPPDGDASFLAPIVDHCLDQFGPRRVLFGSDWPVCLSGASLLTWVRYLNEIVSRRTEEDQRKLWSGNAQQLYSIGS